MTHPRTKYATNKNHSSDDNPRLVEAIRNRTKKVQEQSEASRIAQEEEMSRIMQKNQAEKKYKKKYDHATPHPLGPRRKDGKNFNSSHRNPRGTGSKAKGIIINDPPPQAEQPTHEESDPKTPTEQEGGDKEEESDEGVNEEQSGGKEEEGDKEGDKEIREFVQEQEGYPKGKGKKKEVPNKKKGDHRTDELKMFARGPDDSPLGIPADGGNVLWGYKGSWADIVYNTIDHKHVVRLMKPGTSVSKMRPLCSAFAKRYYVETNTLHLPFGEMTITTNDAKFITGLSIEGKAVKHKEYVQELEWDKIYAWTKEVFQWDEEKSKKEMLVGKAKQRIFHLSRLRSNFMGTKKIRTEGKEVTPQRIIATANAYVLYILGAVIFPDVSGTHVNANFIQLLQLFGKIQDYSWGIAILAHSLTELRKASGLKGTNSEGIWLFCRRGYIFTS
ncbi:uncharacterized protein LOC113360709 [Papaver somniferum]|uniref:uncharacterized protein LOC113360709 n=1 Tax=Papaver somniferum TaxID=3469 RepID=UPI000E6FD212|nr:uncharacterized protein LOC113360709 [Papaver somniferum]